MPDLMKLLALIPKSLQVVIAAMIIGMSIAYAHEVRYMTVSDYTKSYILDLKAAIRELQKLLRDSTLSNHDRETIEDQLAEAIAELCYEDKNDKYCDLQ